MDYLDELFDSLDKRRMPEDVAATILKARPGSVWDHTTRAQLLNVAQHWRSDRWSSMTEDFARPVGADRQLASVIRMFGLDAGLLSLADDPAGLLALIDEVGGPLGWRSGMDWRRDRLRKESRRTLTGFPFVAKRQYNRHVRVLRHLGAKAVTLRAEQVKRRLILVGRSGFACDIERERFKRDPAAARFIAYLVARKNKRRLFSLSGRGNPFDKLAECLLRECDKAGTDWDMIAMVHPVPSVLAHLSHEQLGTRLGSWSALMGQAARLLEEAWMPGVNRESMIVQRGMDSSTWNTVAQAYNAARAGWLNCLGASGQLHLLDPCCPGKVMRLMAADLAWWHRHTGGDVDPQTRVWAALPLPWRVLSGEEPCTRNDVEVACKEVGLDPVSTGWTDTRLVADAAEFAPTPELVHGVEVADPAWALLLRRAGVFSGKHIKPDLAAEAEIGIRGGVVTGQLPVKRLV